jgi:hypothetical protein
VSGTEAGAEPTDLASDFAAMASVLAQGHDVDDTLDRIVQAALATVEVCQCAGIFLVDDGDVRTVAASDPQARRIDALQREAGEGPCLDSVRGGDACAMVGDLLDDERYPDFGPRAAAAGIRSALAVRIVTDRPRGALNLYAAIPHAFGAFDRAKGVILASYASAALGAAEARATDATRRDEQLREALASRGTIGQAQGILMERERITAQQAFDVLRRASQQLNVKLRDVAQRLVDTGEDPRREPPQPR